MARGFTGYRSANVATVRAQALRSVSTTPFVSEDVFISYQRNPSGELVKRTQFGRRSDGATVEKMLEELTDAGNLLPFRRLRLSDGRDISICDQCRLRSTSYLSDLELANRRVPCNPKPVIRVARNY
jgi:hypothetical protein